jgi:hypothetical protein
VEEAGRLLPKEAGRRVTVGGFREWTPRRARRRRGDLWTIPGEEARTTGQGGRTDVGDHGGKDTLYTKPEFEPQDRVASGKTARRSGGSSPHPQLGCRRPDDGSSKAATLATATFEGREGSCEGQRAAPSSCASPRVRGLRGDTEGRTASRREAARFGTVTRRARQNLARGERHARRRRAALRGGSLRVETTGASQNPVDPRTPYPARTSCRPGFRSTVAEPRSERRRSRSAWVRSGRPQGPPNRDVPRKPLEGIPPRYPGVEPFAAEAESGSWPWQVERSTPGTDMRNPA